MNVMLFLEQAKLRGVTSDSVLAQTHYRDSFQLPAKGKLLKQLKGIVHFKSMFDEDADKVTYELNHFTLTRMLGSGCAMGQAFHQLFSQQTDINDNSHEITYLWILVQAYFDDVIDEYEDQDKELLNNISGPKIRKYLEAPYASNPTHFIGTAKSPLVVFTLSLCSQLFMRMSELPGRLSNPNLYQALVDTTLGAFNGEMQTVSRNIGTKVCPKTIHRPLIERCINPFIAIAQSIALTQCNYCYPPKVEAIVYDIATLFRYIDDTTDLEDDVASGTWNSCMADFLACQYPEKYIKQVDISFFEDSVQFSLMSQWCTNEIFVIYDRLYKQLSMGPSAWQNSASILLHLCVSHAMSQQN